MVSDSQLTLDEKSQRCLSLAFLRLMDLDILASSSKEQPARLSCRNNYVKILGEMLPLQLRAYSPGLRGQFAEMYRDSCRDVRTTTHVAMIMSELSVVQTSAIAGVSSSFRVHDEARLIALKEIASYFNIQNGDKHVNHVIEEIVPGPRNLKRIAVITLATVAGGLAAAPHIGSAIGVYALGLSGAAAHSAGLAALGFGATTAGGFGMAGGTFMVAALSGAAGGLSSLAATSSKLRSSTMAEALKLNITLYMMFQLPGTAPIAREIVNRVRASIRDLEDLLKKEKASDSKIRSRVKELESDIKILKASIPEGVPLP